LYSSVHALGIHITLSYREAKVATSDVMSHLPIPGTDFFIDVTVHRSAPIMKWPLSELILGLSTISIFMAIQAPVIQLWAPVIQLWAPYCKALKGAFDGTVYRLVIPHIIPSN